MSSLKNEKAINLYSQFSLPECQEDSLARAGVWSASLPFVKKIQTSLTELTEQDLF